MTPITSQERSALLLAAQGYTDNIAAKHYGKSPRSFRRDLASAQAKLRRPFPHARGRYRRDPAHHRRRPTRR